MLTEIQRRERAELLREADSLSAYGFKDDAARERFDAIMVRVQVIDADAVEGAAPSERERAMGIMQAIRVSGLPQEFGEELLRSGVSLNAARGQILQRLADHDDATRTNGTIAVLPADEGRRPVPTAVRLMAQGLAARCGGPAPENDARTYVHMRAVDMARSCLELNGLSAVGLSPASIVQRALHNTGDFPALLGESGERLLRHGYSTYEGGIKRICRQSTARDFRAKSSLMLGEAPELLKVEENGEVKRGTMAESKASYSLATYARIFGLTRQALVNDDLDAFGSMTMKLGRAAAEFVAAQLAAKLASNPTLADGIALFHSSHGNLGTNGAISITTLTEALKLMRLQKGLDGVTVIDATPKYLVVPAALEVVARQYVAQINATKASDVNPFTADLDVVVDPRLDASSATAWYLSAEPGVIDTIEYSYLEGAEGPEIDTRAGFDIEGIEMKVRLDFGCGVLDHRGLFKNAGA